jgi:hypothetical protein
MFPTRILARIYGLASQKPVESIGYDGIFNGDASAPAEVGIEASWMPGLRPVECDLDMYFKDVFAGQVF